MALKAARSKIRQKWLASDGRTFERADEAARHETALREARSEIHVRGIGRRDERLDALRPRRRAARHRLRRSRLPGGRQETLSARQRGAYPRGLELHPPEEQRRALHRGAARPHQGQDRRRVEGGDRSEGPARRARGSCEAGESLGRGRARDGAGHPRSCGGIGRALRRARGEREDGGCRDGEAAGAQPGARGAARRGLAAAARGEGARREGGGAAGGDAAGAARRHRQARRCRARIGPHRRAAAGARPRSSSSSAPCASRCRSADASSRNPITLSRQGEGRGGAAGRPSPPRAPSLNSEFTSERKELA